MLYLIFNVMKTEHMVNSENYPSQTYSICYILPLVVTVTEIPYFWLLVGV